MGILNYEIGGNEVKIDASEAIANIPENRTLLLEKLTADRGINHDRRGFFRLSTQCGCGV